MTVAELIESLKNFPPDLIVIVPDNDFSVTDVGYWQGNSASSLLATEYEGEEVLIIS